MAADGRDLGAHLLEDVPGLTLDDGAVVHGVVLQDAHPVQCLKVLLPHPAAEGLPVRLLLHDPGEAGVAVHQHHVRKGRQAVLPAVAAEDRGVPGEKDELGPAGAVLHAGVGSQGGGQGQDLRLEQKLPGQLVQHRQDALGQVLPGGEGFGRAQNLFCVKIIDDAVGVGAAGVDADADAHISFPPVSAGRPGRLAGPL